MQSGIIAQVSIVAATAPAGEIRISAQNRMTVCGPTSSIAAMLSAQKAMKAAKANLLPQRRVTRLISGSHARPATTQTNRASDVMLSP